MKFWELSTRVRETVESVSSVLDYANRHRRKIHAGVAGASVMKKRKCAAGSAGYSVLDGVCLCLGQVSKEVKRAEVAALAERALGGVTGELFSEA